MACNVRDFLKDLKDTFPRALAYYNELLDSDKKEKFEKKQREILVMCSDAFKGIEEEYVLSTYDDKKEAARKSLEDYINTVIEYIKKGEKIPTYLTSGAFIYETIANFLRLTFNSVGNLRDFFIRSEEDIASDNTGDFGCEQEHEIVKHLITDKFARNILVYHINQKNHMAYLKKEFKDGINLFGTYCSDHGVTLEERKAYEGVAIGNSKSYYITNDSMDLVISRMMRGWDSIQYMEKEIFSTINRLREGGFYLIETPDFMIRSNYLTKLASNFVLVGSFRMDQNYIPGMNCIGIVAKKKSNMPENEVDKNYLDFNNALKNVEDLFEVCKKIKENSPVTPIKKKIHIYGSGIDKMLVEIIFKESPLSINSIKERHVNAVPVLPLRRGQIAQVLASGKLNGIIDEGNGYKHVIRGCIYKGSHIKPSTIEENPKNTEEYIRTTKTIENNMVEINMFTGSGKYRTIAMN